MHVPPKIISVHVPPKIISVHVPPKIILVHVPPKIILVHASTKIISFRPPHTSSFVSKKKSNQIFVWSDHFAHIESSLSVPQEGRKVVFFFGLLAISFLDHPAN